ncbi:MAG: outer membrane protein transport protein [Candidatus Aminicenantes bacterium]|nr:outer membrane protein transport protein [Candidatus Aminicenantes bacterium]
MKKMWKTARLFVTVVLIAASGISLSANGLNLNGVGSKAIAMGGAFIGQADDYSAVFWNPAGLTQMKNTSLSLFGTDLIPSVTYTLSAYGIDAKSESKMYPSGAVGFFKPVSDKLVLGILAYVPAGSGAKWNGEDLKLLSFNKALEWESMIAVISVSPAIAYKITDTLSIGATLNINYGMLNLKKPALFSMKLPSPPYPPNTYVKYAEQYSEDETAVGFGATFGVLYKPSDKLGIGVSLRLPCKIKFKGTAENPLAQTLLHVTTTSDIERDATWPMWIGGGVSFKPIDKLTVNADLQYTNWKKVEKIEAIYSDTAWQASFATGAALQLRWIDKIQYRLGLQYQLCEKFSLRGGYYYDPCVGPDETLTILLPQFTYNVVTLGVGYRTGKLSLDVCVEYLMGQERTIDAATLTATDPGMPGVHGMNILVPNIAFTYRF